jgi:RecA-family ATPase
MVEALKSSARAEPTEFEAMTLPNLMQAELPPPNWCIPGLLAEGLNLLAGAPKSGKSMLSLNLAFAVAGGGKALQTIQTTPGDVLYLSLEDKLRRIQARSRKMISVYGEAGMARLAVVTSWPRMDLGGLVMLKEWVKRVERPTLIIIDVLGKFRPPSRSKGNQYEEDSQHLYEIKRFGDDHGLTVMVNHHTRKSKGKDEPDDPFESISGTLGIGGACDGILLLKRLRGQDTGVLSVTGRDDAEQRLALQFTTESLTWKSLGSADEHLTGQLQVQVLNYLKLCQPHPVFPRDIADHLKHDSTDRVRTTCHRLFDRGLIRKHGNAWAYPGPHETAGGEEEM